MTINQWVRHLTKCRDLKCKYRRAHLYIETLQQSARYGDRSVSSLMLKRANLTDATKWTLFQAYSRCHSQIPIRLPKITKIRTSHRVSLRTQFGSQSRNEGTQKKKKRGPLSDDEKDTLERTRLADLEMDLETDRKEKR